MKTKTKLTFPTPVDLGDLAVIREEGDAPAIGPRPSLVLLWQAWARQLAEVRAAKGVRDAGTAVPPDGDHFVLVGLHSTDCAHGRVRDDAWADARECATCVAASVAAGWTARLQLVASVRWPTELDTWSDFCEWVPPEIEPRAAIADSPESGDEIPDDQARAMLAARLETLLDPMGPGGDIGVRLRERGPWAALACLVDALEGAARARAGGAR